MAVNGGVLRAWLDVAVAESLRGFLLTVAVLTGLLVLSAGCEAFLFRVRGDVVEDR